MIFWEVFSAVKDFVPDFGRSASKTKDRKGKVKSYELKFYHLGTFIHHMSELSGLNKSDVKKYMKKTFSTGGKGKVIIEEEKPVVFLYNVSNNLCSMTCNFETINKFGNVTSY